MSTLRILRLSGEDGAAAGNSTLRILRLSGSDQNGTAAVTITGPTELEAGEPFTLTPEVTGATATSYTWVQTGGPTVVNTGLTNFEGDAPASSTETTLTFQVTINPGGATDTHAITVHPSSVDHWINGEFVPDITYVIVSGGTGTVTYDGGTAATTSFDLILDGGVAGSSYDTIVDGGTA